MAMKTKIMLYLGAVFAACTVGSLILLFLGPDPAHRWWIGATALSSGWIFAGVAFGPWRWVRTAVPCTIVSMFAVFYVMDHTFDSSAVILLMIAAAAAATHVWSVRRALHA